MAFRRYTNPRNLFRSFFGGGSVGRRVQSEGRRTQRQVLREATPGALRGSDARMLQRFLRRLRRPKGAKEPQAREFEGLDEFTEEELAAARAAPRRRRGPATILERRVRLEQVLDEAEAGGIRLEFRANTIAVVQPPGLLTRIKNFILMVILLPFVLLKRLLEWAMGRQGGKGKVGRQVITVDRAGRVHIHKV